VGDLKAEVKIHAGIRISVGTRKGGRKQLHNAASLPPF